MIVRCIGISRAALPEGAARAAFDDSVHLDEVGLTIGRCYVVYGIALSFGSSRLPWFLVCQDASDEYPIPHLGAHFEVVDGAIPGDWRWAPTTNVGEYALLPECWASNPRFMEELVDRDSDAIAAFRRLQDAYAPK